MDKKQITNLGISHTVGDLLDKLNAVPFNADFGFRNHPMLTLNYDEKNVSCFFSPVVLQRDFNEFQKVHGAWSDETFGIRSPLGPLHHLLKEVNEVIADPANIEEYADCGLLLMDSLRLTGFTMDDLFDAMAAKFSRNRQRTWGKPDKNGTVEHIR